MKKQDLQITANNRAVMVWTVSIKQNDLRSIFGIYTDSSEAVEAEKHLQKQGFDTAFLETCVEFAERYVLND